MIESDPAELHQVTGNLNLAVRRNKVRFPQDFMFRLSASEANIFAIAFCKTKRGGGRRSLPYTFIEQRVAMLSSFPRSERAVLVNIAIMRAFVRQALPFSRVVDDLLSMNGEAQEKRNRHARVEIQIAYGVKDVEIEGVSARITSPARTIVDFFRFERFVGPDVAMEALSDGLRQRKVTVAKLSRVELANGKRTRTKDNDT